MSIYDLWLPITLSGVAAHIWSMLAWTVLPHHTPEWVRLPVEDELQDLMFSRAVPPGQYMFPFASGGKEAASEAYQQKTAKCRGMVILWEKPLNMGKAIGCTLLFFLCSAFVIGYLASLALPPGATFQKVFQFVMTAGLLTHCAAHFPHVFWFKRRIAMELLDGVITATVTGLIFAMLWPAASGV